MMYVYLLYLLKPLVTLVVITLATNFAFAICKTVKGRALLRGGKGAIAPYFFRIYYIGVLNLEIFKKSYYLVAAPQVSKC